MRNHLSQHLTRVMLWAIILVVISACNPSPVTVTAIPTLAANPSNTPAPTLPATARFTALPVPSDTPAPAVQCFVTYYDPFAFMPDGKRLLVRGVEGVQIFNLQHLQEESFLEAPSSLNGPVVALSPDGEILAWALEDGTIQLVRVSDQAVLTSIHSGQASPIKLEFTPTGDRLFSASHDGWVKVWDGEGNLLNSFQPGGLELMNIGVSPDGTMLATIPSDGEVSLWNLDNFKLIRGYTSSGGYDTSDVAFSPDGQYLAADLATGLFLWSIRAGTELLGSKDAINSMAVTYSADWRFLAYSDNNIIVLSSPDGSQTICTLEGHQSPIFALLFSPDSSILVSADDMEMHVWRVEDGQLLATGKHECP